MSKVYLCQIFKSAIYEKCLKFCISQFVKWMEIKWQRKDMMQTNFHGDLVSFFLCPFRYRLIVFRFRRHCWKAYDTELLYCYEYDYDLTDETLFCLNISATLNLIHFKFLTTWFDSVVIGEKHSIKLIEIFICLELSIL